MYALTLRGSFPFDSPPKSVVKEAWFWGFLGSRIRGVLGEISSILSILNVLVDQILAMEGPWCVPTIPKVLHRSVERFGTSGVGFGGVDPRVLFIPERPSWPVWQVLLTGLTGAEALWVLPRLNSLVCSLLSRVAVVSSLGRFGARKVGLDYWGFLA
jgi:hypothetical protein